MDKLKLLALDFGQITTPGAYDPKSSTIGPQPYTTALERIISNVLVVLTIVAGIAFILYFLIGGLTWITSGGDKGKVETAKGYMTSGVIGLIVVILSYSIVYIVGRVLGLNILEPSEIISPSFIKFR